MRSRPTWAAGHSVPCLRLRAWWASSSPRCAHRSRVSCCWSSSRPTDTSCSSRRRPPWRPTYSRPASATGPCTRRCASATRVAPPRNFFLAARAESLLRASGVSAGGVATRDPDPGVGDIDAARALVARLYREYEAGDGLRCHETALEVTRYLRLVRIIVPQHPLWTVNPYRRCDFRCTYCSVHAQGSAVPVLTGEAFRRRLRLELDVVPPDHHVALSSMCDAYVPAEAQLGIARLAIEELLAAGRCVHVVTKGVTVLRDADLLRRARCGKVEVSLCTLDEKIAAELEPGAPPPAERLALVEALAGAGIDVGIMIAPWIPGVKIGRAHV